MTIWDSLFGMERVRLTCAEPEAALRNLSEAKVSIRELSREDDFTCAFKIARLDQTTLERICNKKGYTFQVISQMGAYYRMKMLLSHKLLMIGLLFLLFLVLFIPTRVLFVSVDGNVSIPSKEILSRADACGIRFGASRRKVRSEKTKNMLLSAIPELKWAGINTYGCTAVISVKEKTETVRPEAIPGGICSIVASRDGLIESCTATKGSLLCRIGQAVSKGDVLISGYTDHGICLQACAAEGEIVGRTVRSLDTIMPSMYESKGEKQVVKKHYSIRLGKKLIKLWPGSGIWDASCDRMYWEYILTLPGGFQLPAAICVNVYTKYSMSQEEYLRPSAELLLQKFARQFIQQEMVAGKILQEEYVLTKESGRFILYSLFNCEENIGVVQWEQDGDYNG